MSNLLRNEQRLFDKKYLDPSSGYAELDPIAQKVALIGTSLGKITSRKLIHWANNGWEKPEMRAVVLGEVIPDLCICRTQLADISFAQDRELDAGAEALKPGILTVNKAKIYTTLVEARGDLDDFLVPMVDDEDDLYDFIMNAAVLIHFSAEAAGRQYGITPEALPELHQNRLTQLASDHDARIALR